jgi:hypothetical protein
MSKQQLHQLVESLPDSQVPAAIALLSELGDEEIIDTETAARLDAALAEPGDNISLEELRRRCAA